MNYEKEPHGVYFLIDNKSFYASVEALKRGLNPLKTILVVMSEAENTNGGLILATSPQAKKVYGLKANVSRKRDLPQDKKLIVAPPRMNLYIERNLQINDIFRQFAAKEDVWPYSIDESIIDMTHSWHLFGDSPYEVARLIQKTVRQKLGLYTTVGIGENPVQAKLALDIYAKHDDDLIGTISYQDVPQKIWTIDNLTDVWGIGRHLAKRLHRLGINNMNELAHANPFYLKKYLGIIGWQVYATAWGIDRSDLHKKPAIKNKSVGNSQVLPRDYQNEFEIKTVIREIGQQVASRLRHRKQKASRLSLSIGYSFQAQTVSEEHGFQLSRKITPSDSNEDIVFELQNMFQQKWNGLSIRNIGVYTSDLVYDTGQQLNLFDSVAEQTKKYDVDKVVDNIRQKYGFNFLVYSRSKTSGGTAITHSELVGGHNGGNAYD